MAKFKVLLQRVGYAEVEVEAKSATEARSKFEDEDFIYDSFHSAGNSWYDREIKVKSVVREKE